MYFATATWPLMFVKSGAADAGENHFFEKSNNLSKCLHFFSCISQMR